MWRERCSKALITLLFFDSVIWEWETVQILRLDFQNAAGENSRIICVEVLYAEEENISYKYPLFLNH